MEGSSLPTLEVAWHLPRSRTLIGSPDQISGAVRSYTESIIQMYTVKPGYNEPSFNEYLDLTNSLQGWLTAQEKKITPIR